MPENILPPKQETDPQVIPADKAGPGTEREALRQRRIDRMKKRTALSDCIVMLRYALDEGRRLPDQVIADIAAIDSILISAGDDPLSERPFSLRDVKTTTSANGADNVEPDKLLLSIHNGLSDLVAPANAVSLRATDPDVVKFGLPLIAKVAILGALFSTFIFIVAVSKTQPPSSGATGSPRPTPRPTATLTVPPAGGLPSGPATGGATASPATTVPRTP